MNAMFLLLWCALLQEPIDVCLTMREGGVVKGTMALEDLRLETSFGTALVRPDALLSVELGNSASVVTLDQTALQGTLEIEAFTVRTGGVEESFPLQKVARLVVERWAEPRPGQVTDGVACNGLTYHVRAPKDYRADQPWPAVLILHGANMNSRMYVETIVGQWPSIAQRYVLLGIDGEILSSGAPGEPRFNYTYVSYAGRSKYKGLIGTERESPALVAEAIEEIKARMSVSRLFIGGHSQGGFLAYSVMMNFPHLVDGAFPMSGGLIIQCEPAAYEDEALVALQRRKPLAIIHGTTDPNVAFDMGLHAWEAFEDAGFPMLRLFTDEQAGHRFAFLPLEAAIEWLEAMTDDDPARLADFAEESMGAGEHRDAQVVVLRGLQFAPGQLQPRFEAVQAALDAAAGEPAQRLAEQIQAAAGDACVDEFLSFRARYRYTPAAQPAMEAWEALRAGHQPEADRLFAEAREDFQRGDQEAGRAKCRRIMDEFYASSWYRLARRMADEQR